MDGGSGDGRLDLDELGTVVEAASRLDDADAAEVLDDGHGRSWRERAHDSGLAPWARRHRVALAVVGAAAVLAGAAVAAWTLWVPPPLDPQLRVTVTDLVPTSATFPDGGIVDFAAPGVMWLGVGQARAAYGLTPQDGGDTATYAVLGIEGPAVRASTAHDHELDGSVPVAADVDAMVDCWDVASLDPEPGSYALRVARTDAWNRTVVGLVPVADPAQGWPASVASMCAGQQARSGIEIRDVTVRASAAGGAATTLELDVVNRLPVEVEVSTTPSGGLPPVLPSIAPTRLAAGSPGRLLVRLEVADCVAPTLYPIGITSPDDPQPTFGESAPGMYLHLDLLTRSSSPTGDDPRPTATAEVRWSQAVARRIDAALAASCAGAPRPPAVRVTTVGRSSAVITEQSGDSTADRSVLLVLRVPTTGDRVRIQTPDQPADFYVGSFVAPAAADVVDGRATLVTTWSYDCSGGGFDRPPTVEVRITTARGEFPFFAPVRSAELTRELLDSCEYADEQQLVDAGWPIPAPPVVLMPVGS